MTGYAAGHDREVHVLLPGDVASASGGNVYDRRVVRDLAEAHGWRVRRTDLLGSWSGVDDAAISALGQALTRVPEGGLVLVDGLVACALPEVVEPAARRLRIVVLVHLPLADETGLSTAAATELARREARTLRAVAAVVVTSSWAARRLRPYGLTDPRVHVATPGTDVAPLAGGSLAATGAARILCVGAVTPRKDQLTLVSATSRLAELPWSCLLVGPLDRDPAYVEAVRAEVATAGLDGRVRLTGPLEGAELGASYDAADLLVLVSRTETFGMVITEALSRGLPVLTTAGGAAEETLGAASDGSVPGLLVPPADVNTLAAALRSWLTDSSLRDRLTASARVRRATLGGWDQTARTLDQVLDAVRTEPVPR